jgi:SPP1 gp7 family putative phage head morphogenesis protein
MPDALPPLSLPAARVGDARRDTRKEREAFARVRNAEVKFTVQLRSVAKHIGDLVKGMASGSPHDLDTLTRLLDRYSVILRPWARAISASLLADVSRRDEKAWAQYARFMGLELRKELAETPTGEIMRQLLDEQVDLITSLPLEAAKRVQAIATGQLYSGQRAEVLAKQIMLSGEVAKSRADTIARTETTRAATTLTQARAKQIGSEGYIWRTAHDWNVRPLHKKLEGTFHRWDAPPIAGSNGERAHPGAIYNCRCYPEPVIPNA